MHILYLMPSKFPYGWAYSARVLNYSRILKDNNHKITVMAHYLSDSKYKTSEKRGIIEDINIHYTGSSQSLIEKIIMPIKYRRELKEFLYQNDVDLIISSSMSDKFSIIYPLARKNNIPIILESCEWHNPTNWTFGKYDPRYWQFINCWNNYFNKTDGIIAISRLLQQHYLEYTDKVIRIPTIMDVENTSFSEVGAQQDKIQLAFAGGLGNGKDSLTVVFEALYKIKEKRNKFFLNIYGPNEKQLRKQFGKKEYLLNELTNCYKIHGRIRQEEMNNIYKTCDYGIFIRPNRRSSHAGFPTKLAEFMATGTPVITNNTGDIGLYLKNGINGFLLKDSSDKTVIEILSNILLMSREKKNEMRREARKSAERSFDYRIYKKTVDNFLNDIYIKKRSPNKS